MEDVGSGPLGIDTAPFIYYIEDHESYASLLDPVFRAIDATSLAAVTSTLTLLEVLVAPFRSKDTALAARYEAILTRGRGLALVELRRGILRAAAKLRATRDVRTPDAIQLAAAVAAGCTAYLTNNRRLPRIPGLRILVLDDYLAE
jgi:predicted nucleic acid-binding protein